MELQREAGLGSPWRLGVGPPALLPRDFPEGREGGLGLGQGVTFHEPTDLLGEGDGLHLAERWGGRCVRRERGVKAWCQGRRAGRRLSPGGGTCTSAAAAAAAAARPGRRAGPRARGALRKWRARRAGGAPRAVGRGGTPVRGCTRHSRGALRWEDWRAGRAAPANPPPEQKTKRGPKELHLLGHFLSSAQGSRPPGTGLEATVVPEMGREEAESEEIRPRQAQQQAVPDLARPRPENRDRTFTVSFDKPVGSKEWPFVPINNMKPPTLGRS